MGYETKLLILASVILLLLFIVFIILLMVNYSNKMVANKLLIQEQELKLKNRKIEEELNIRNEVDQERLRIGRDLHDDLGSTLSSVQLKLELLKIYAKLSPEQNQIFDSILNEYKSIFILYRKLLNNINFETQNIQLFVEFITKFGKNYFINSFKSIEFHINLFHNDYKIDGKIKGQLYLIFKEIFVNIIKHSNATKVDVYLSDNHENFLIKILDNGKNDISELKQGYGTNNIINRIKEIGKLNKYNISQNGFCCEFSFVIGK